MAKSIKQEVIKDETDNKQLFNFPGQDYNGLLIPACCIMAETKEEALFIWENRAKKLSQKSIS